MQELYSKKVLRFGENRIPGLAEGGEQWMTFLMAAHDAGLQYVGFEKDKYYYDLSKERLEEHTAQINIFDFLEDKA